LEKEKAKEKNFFVKFAPIRSIPKWTSNKMGNAKKDHNKTGRAKVVATKRRASYCASYRFFAKCIERIMLANDKEHLDYKNLLWCSLAL